MLDVSLAQVFATPLGQLKAYEITAFCCEILTGIEYIYKKLGIVHGDINTENILLSADGSVNIGILSGFLKTNFSHHGVMTDAFLLSIPLSSTENAVFIG